eukprot:CAMPEP_0118836106 /NCGR_PEP_ID=MMETSP1162-20130426/57085_1 /TAXON_ID=33656 /ORGANISM="Phaeocystis Sp, Strain CCMP2710" /LENGTH=77 /DNA_ID=CAMNT_0006767909 /DNA_START=18 /DNA_END=251 /DNA_ORIENTATION=+
MTRGTLRGSTRWSSGLYRYSPPGPVAVALRALYSVLADSDMSTTDCKRIRSMGSPRQTARALICASSGAGGLSTSMW